jgi:hypothetical protein
MMGKSRNAQYQITRRFYKGAQGIQQLFAI